MNLSALMITLNTPLGPASEETLMFESLSASEELGRLFSMDITALSTKATHDPLEMLGKEVSVALELQDGSQRHLHGHVSSFGLAGRVVGLFPVPHDGAAVVDVPGAPGQQPHLSGKRRQGHPGGHLQRVSGHPRSFASSCRRPTRCGSTACSTARPTSTSSAA